MEGDAILLLTPASPVPPSTWPTFPGETADVRAVPAVGAADTGHPGLAPGSVSVRRPFFARDVPQASADIVPPCYIIQ